MSLYPSLEDMKMDQMHMAQLSYQSHIAEPTMPALTRSVPSAPMYPNIGTASPPPPYSLSPTAPPSAAPKTVSPTSLALYPTMEDFMGLELSPEVLRANMLDYTVSVPNVPEAPAALPQYSTTIGEHNMVAPLSSQTLGLQRAQVTHGLREVTLCKDASGKVGLRVCAVNKGVFVSVVSKGSPAAMCGIRFGDQILQINGISVAGYSMTQVHDLFRKSTVNGINIILRDRPFERTITLHKDSMGQVGFQFKNGKITGLVKDSSAARNGLLTEHNLLEVDGQNVVGLKDKEITALIEKAPANLAASDQVKNGSFSANAVRRSTARSNLVL
ncbi:hypothetical protein LSTR_LSTR005747 [Laodelphax striatellus]|uniref:PDZ domain-containing protein n=1 Tax=Laodelphax striatellus TaxID=195883 RepID=A0A482XHN8_LAOST|nr:hypothetical protein LSTR_LSTR005747 [Laodelphax striatellus]